VKPISRAWLAAAVASGLLAGAAQAGDFMPLYNGKDFTGWHVVSGKLAAWKAQPEMISCTEKGGGCLLTDREYGDFELRLEYRVPPGGNTGIGIHVPPGGWPSTDGFEIQILDDEHPRYRGKVKPEDGHGAVYKHAAPTARPFKPAGEWNQITVRCQGPLLVIQVNGIEIHHLNLDDFNESYGKGKIPLGKRPRKGQLGFPSHGDPVDFRHIELREL
jgi:hypothetical protein